MPQELTAVPTWDSMSPGEKQAWPLDKALDCKREILTLPMPDPAEGRFPNREIYREF
jgi:hypothetical protein